MKKEITLQLFMNGQWADVIKFIEQLHTGASPHLVKSLRRLIKPLSAIENTPGKNGIEPELFQLIGPHLKAQIKALRALKALQ